MYKIVITYTLAGYTQSYTGTFLGRDLGEAMRNGRDFVIKYIKPSNIVEVSRAPEIEV